MSITSYELQILGPDAVWTSLIGGSTPSLLLTHIEESLQTGFDYRFRVRASNSFGWGPYSEEVTIRADEVPAQAAPVTSTVETSNVRISWEQPSTDNGSAIQEFRLFIQTSDSAYVDAFELCDGTDSDIVSSNAPSCVIPMIALRAVPYSLTKGSIVRAKVQSRNVNGWSPLSIQDDNGAVIETEPNQMQAPTKGASTNQQQVEVMWTAFSDSESAGLAEITSYHVQWDKATSGAEWFDIVGLDPAFLGLSLIQTLEVLGG